MSRVWLFHGDITALGMFRSPRGLHPPNLQPILGAGIFGNPGCFPDAGKTGLVPARRPAGLSTPTLAPSQPGTQRLHHALPSRSRTPPAPRPRGGDTSRAKPAQKILQIHPDQDKRRGHSRLLYPRR